jgi:hypothetical protein
VASGKHEDGDLLSALTLEMREISAIGVLHSEAMSHILGIHKHR